VGFANKMLFAALLLLLASHAAGQTMNARIFGDVQDEDGGYLAGVTVTAVHVGSNAEMKAITQGKGGSFRFLALPPGIYQVSFDLEGYVPYVAAGISLVAEQSVNLHVKLKRSASFKAAPALPSAARAAGDGEPGEAGRPERFSVALGGGAGYLAAGDINDYYRRFYRRNPGAVLNALDSLNGGSDWSAELGIRVRKRWELGVGLGLAHGHLKGNDVTFARQGSPQAQYMMEVKMKTFPLQLIGRYLLYEKGAFTFSSQASLLYHFASFHMSSDRLEADQIYGRMILLSRTREHATARGLGATLGGHGEVRLDGTIRFTIDLFARFSPLRGFSGKRVVLLRSDPERSEVTNGRLWFYEYYDPGAGRWLWDLSIGEKPTGGDVRHVSQGTVDFSGIVLRAGLVFRF